MEDDEFERERAQSKKAKEDLGLVYSIINIYHFAQLK